MWKLVTLVAMLSPSIAAAQSFSCGGSDPEWTLSLQNDQAEFNLTSPLTMEIPQKTTAEGREWPKALTLINGIETAIVLIDRDQCTANGRAFPLSVDILTQRNSIAIVLTGCCTQTAE
jgi:hypothetical protein